MIAMSKTINDSHTDGTLRECAESADDYVWVPPVVDLDSEDEQHGGCALCRLDADIRVGRWLYVGVQGKYQVCNEHIDFVREYGFEGMAPRSLVLKNNLDVQERHRRDSSGMNIDMQDDGEGICCLCGGTEAEGYRMFVVGKLVFCLDHAMDVRRYGPIGAAGKMFMRLRVRAIEAGDDQMLAFTGDVIGKTSGRPR